MKEGNGKITYSNGNIFEVIITYLRENLRMIREKEMDK